MAIAAATANWRLAQSLIDSDHLLFTLSLTACLHHHFFDHYRGQCKPLPLCVEGSEDGRLCLALRRVTPASFNLVLIL